MDIEQALTRELLDAGLGLDLVWQNGIFSVWDGTAYQTQRGTYPPEDGRPYAEIRILENDTTAAALRGRDRTDGVIRVILHRPRGEGTAPARAAADTVFAAFPMGGRLNFGDGGVLTITAHQTRPGVPADGWYTVQVDANYQAFNQR